MKSHGSIDIEALCAPSLRDAGASSCPKGPNCGKDWFSAADPGKRMDVSSSMIQASFNLSTSASEHGQRPPQRLDPFSALAAEH